MISNTSLIVFSSFLVSLIVVPMSWGGTDCKNILFCFMNFLNRGPHKNRGGTPAT